MKIGYESAIVPEKRNIYHFFPIDFFGFFTKELTFSHCQVSSSFIKGVQ